MERFHVTDDQNSQFQQVLLEGTADCLGIDLPRRGHWRFEGQVDKPQPQFCDPLDLLQDLAPGMIHCANEHIYTLHFQRGTLCEHRHIPSPAVEQSLSAAQLPAR